MAPINDAVFLRRNNQIQDAIDGQNLKQALQLIEKRVKKGEDTPFLKVSRARSLQTIAQLFFPLHVCSTNRTGPSLTVASTGLESAYPLAPCG